MGRRDDESLMGLRPRVLDAMSVRASTKASSRRFTAIWREAAEDDLLRSVGKEATIEDLKAGMAVSTA